MISALSSRRSVEDASDRLIAVLGAIDADPDFELSVTLEGFREIGEGEYDCTGLIWATESMLGRDTAAASIASLCSDTKFFL